MAERVLVCGGRNFNDRGWLAWELNRLATLHPDLEVICGYDPDDDRFQGADQLAYEWARSYGLAVFPFPAPWKARGRSAGPFRNQRMIDCGRPHRVLPFPGGRGTADMVSRAHAAGIPVDDITPEGER